MSVSLSVLSLADFTAYELPTKKWMKMFCPKMRLRVRAQNRHFVSSSVKVRDGSPDGSNVSSVHWPWLGDEQSPRPTFADDEVFDVEVERRFLFWHKCIRRTKPVTIDQVRTGNHCALSLYDGDQLPEMLEDRIEMGEITFTLWTESSSDGKASLTTYSS